MNMDLVQLDVNAPYYRLNKIVYSAVKKIVNQGHYLIRYTER